jgi:hypothetical protein
MVNILLDKFFTYISSINLSLNDPNNAINLP